MPAERVTSNSPWHLVLLLDDSGSMGASGATKSLNEALDALIEEMKLLSQGTKPYFRLSIISFGSSTRLIAEAQSEQMVDKAKITSFTGDSGSTDMAGAFREAAAVLNRHPGRSTDFDPYIFLFTDGQPDNEEAALSAARVIHGMEVAAGKPRLVAIGLGPDVRMGFLQQIGTSGSGLPNPEFARHLPNPVDISKALPPVGTIVSSGGGTKVVDQAIIDL
jgi:uncharacterized protein YegL